MKSIVLSGVLSVAAVLSFAQYSHATAEVFVNRYGQTVEQLRWPHEPAGYEYTVCVAGTKLWEKVDYQVYEPLDKRYSYRKVTIYAADGKTKTHAQVWDKLSNGSYKLREVIEFDKTGTLAVRMWALASDGKTPERLYNYHTDGKSLVSIEELRKDGTVSRALLLRVHGIASSSQPSVKTFGGADGGTRKLDADRLTDKVKDGSLEPKP